MTLFRDLGLRAELTTSLEELGYEEPTPIQSRAIPALLEGRDVLGQAATGTGKTAAFALPILHRIAEGERGGKAPTALVLVPTRELAIQVAEAVHRYGRGIGIRVVPIYGGQPIGRQLAVLNRGVDVVVATPGRALDHLSRGTLSFDRTCTVVLDEADEMLDMGFADEIETLLQATPTDRQTVLFSATVPARIERIADRHLRDPVRLEIKAEATPQGAAPRLRQVAYVVPRAHKAAALGRVLDLEEPGGTVVFCRTRNEVDTLTETIGARGFRAEALHGGMDQDQRDRAMGRLRSGAIDVLVATDVAARGLDIDTLTHVVNFDVPSAPDDYVHRVGRVGRAGRTGTAITFVDPREHRQLRNIERATKQRIVVESVPTIADLRNRRMEKTLASLQETLAGDADELEQFRVVVETLSVDHDVMDIALAAVRLAHEATSGVEDADDIPAAAPAPAPESRPRAGASSARTRLYVSLGRSAGIRPQDLVGAITGETRLNGRDIGAIEIADKFALVEVPDAAVDEVIAALSRSTIKGRRPTVRRERYSRPPRRG